MVDAYLRVAAMLLNEASELDSALAKKVLTEKALEFVNGALDQLGK